MRDIRFREGSKTKIFKMPFAIDKINDRDNYESFNYSDAFSTKFINH